MFLLCLGWVSHASAQFRIGAEAGYLNSNYYIIGFNRQPQQGFLLGAIASYTIRDIAWLESGITLQQKGFRFDPPQDDIIPNSINDVRMKAYYLNIPLLMGLKLNVTNELSILPKVGAFFSYGLHAKAAFAGLTHEEEAFTTEYNKG
ncbi:MAG: PorT family protein, partial [Tannerellaceae bacterium]|nr:PorT family protein [Tannerellaceae bacterium]